MVNLVRKHWIWILRVIGIMLIFGFIVPATWYQAQNAPSSPLMTGSGYSANFMQNCVDHATQQALTSREALATVKPPYVAVTRQVYLPRDRVTNANLRVDVAHNITQVTLVMSPQMYGRYSRFLHLDPSVSPGQLVLSEEAVAGLVDARLIHATLCELFGDQFHVNYTEYLVRVERGS